MSKSQKLAEKQEVYPTALVPGAKSLSEVFQKWKEKGFHPTEITKGEQLQKIVITHDPLKGELKWETFGPLDGLMATEMIANAMLLMPALLVGETAFSVAEYFTTGPGRIDLGSGQAMVLIALKDGKLSIDWNPKENTIVAKKLLASALLYLIAKDAGLPLEKILRHLEL